MIYEFLADGFEETEAIVPLDILRRAGKTVVTVGVTGKTVTGAHGIAVTADAEIGDVKPDDGLEAIILPGGTPGTENLEKSAGVREFTEYAAKHGAVTGAICAAPSIPGRAGFLAGKRAVCFPGFEKTLLGAKIENSPSVRDGNMITAKGAGAAFEFGFALCGALCGEEKRRGLEESMQWSRRET